MTHPSGVVCFKSLLVTGDFAMTLIIIIYILFLKKTENLNKPFLRDQQIISIKLVVPVS